MATAKKEALDYKHSGRTYSTTPYNILKSVEIKSQEHNSPAWQCMCFTLDKLFMRPSAIGFDQFNEDTQGKAMLKAFSFYVQLCYLLTKDGDAQDGQSCAVFLEWVKHATIDNKFIGIRLFLFSNRKGKKGKAYDMVQDMIFQNDQKSNKNNRQFLKNRMAHDAWESVTSYFDYARQVADVYTRTHDASSDMNNPNYHQPSHAANPLCVFSPQQRAFNISDADPLQISWDKYETDGTISFPIMERVYRMMPCDLHLDKFFHKYLPDYYFTRVIFPDAVFFSNFDETGNVSPNFKLKVDAHMHIDRFVDYFNSIGEAEGENTWMFPIEKKEEIEDKIKDHFAIVSDNNESQLTGAADVSIAWLTATAKSKSAAFQNHSLVSDSTPTVSPIISTLLTDKHALSDLDILRIVADYKREWMTNKRKFKESIVKEFVERVWDDTYADVSESAKMILLWKTNIRKDEDMNFQFKKVDPNMSIFSNRAIRLLEFYDKSLFVSSAHKALFLLNHSKYDAYRQETNLHFNQGYTGEGATSKSYLFEKMEQMSITGTVETLTYQTTKADAIDGDIIDVIQVFNEAPPGMFMTNKHTDGQQEAMFKEKLTSMRVSVKEFWRDENTGERKNRVAKSQSIGVCMGATNDDPSLCSEAMRTRFYWGQFHKYGDLLRSIQLCMRGDRELEDCPGAKRERERMLLYCKEEQMRMWLVFKFIYMGILQKPTLKAADVVYDRVTTHLKTKHKVNIPPRTKERFEMLCTIYTIINALEIVFNVEGGLNAGTPENHNVFHPIQLLDIEPFMFCTEEIAIFSLTQISEEIVNPNEFKVLKAIWELHKKSNNYREEVKTTEDGQSIKLTDNNYICVNNGKRLLTEIINAIPSSAGKMSKHNISSLLNDWNEKCVNCPIYQECNQMLATERKFQDGFPQPMPNNKDKKIQLIHDHNRTYLHIHLFKGVRKNEYTNIMKEAIKSLNHQHAWPHRKFMLGCSIMEKGAVKHPNVLDTVNLTRTGEVISLVNPLFTNSITKSIQGVTQLDTRQTVKRYKIKKDLTVLGACEHMKNIGITEQIPNHAKGVLEYYRRVNPCVDNPIEYPQSIISPPVEEDFTEEVSDDESDMIDFDTIEEVQPNKRQRTS